MKSSYSSRRQETSKLFQNYDERGFFFFSPYQIFHARPQLNRMCAGKALGKLSFYEEVGLKTGRRQLLNSESIWGEAGGKKRHTGVHNVRPQFMWVNTRCLNVCCVSLYVTKDWQSIIKLSTTSVRPTERENNKRIQTGLRGGETTSLRRHKVQLHILNYFKMMTYT